MKSSLPTLANVAEIAGVGIATVSRVVNGGPHVSVALQKKVEAAVLKLGYQPNHAARILKGGRTKTVGLLMPSIADPFFARCAEAAEKVARAHDTLLIFALSENDPGLEMKKLSVLMRHRPDGLLIVPAGGANRRLRQFVRASSVPIVTLDRPLPNCPAVLTNGFEASRDATLHLIGHGCREILCLGTDAELHTIRERLRGYHKAMEVSQLTPRVALAPHLDAASTEAILRVEMNAKKPPDAIFALKNSATLATFKALQRLRISVPGDVSLVGFDDFELAGTLRPAITVVRQPIEEIGSRAAGLLFAMIDNKGSTPATAKNSPVVLTNSLIPRRSCGCRPRVTSEASAEG